MLTPKMLTHEVKLNGTSLTALIDTGSETSLINSEVATMNNLVPKGPSLHLSGANSMPIKCYGHVSADLAISIDDITKTAKRANLAVAEHLCAEIIIGLDMLKWLRILVDAGTLSVIFKPEPKNIDVAVPRIIPSRSQVVVNAVVPTGLTGAVRTIPFNLGYNDLLVANPIDTIKGNQVRCLVTNLDIKPKTLNLGDTLTSYEIIPSQENDTRTNAVMQVGHSDAYVTIGDNLSEDQIEQPKCVLDMHQEAFSLFGELGCTNALEHDIELTGNAKPHAEPLRRRPVVHRNETRQQVRKMLEQGVIEESSSPWAAAYVLAKKKSGELRLCIDFRKLDDVTKKNVYPLPNIEDCIESLAGKKFFSQLDMASGFWQLPLTQRAREMTAFRTEDGHFQFTRMRFGLTNAPASFQRLVNIVFAGLKGLDLQVFIDDLCIASTSWEQHLSMLAKVFKLLIQAKLKLKSNKCTFGVPSVIFLGHEISADGIRQDPQKLRAIQNLPSPKRTKDLRATLGLLNYYRKFVPNFSILTEPLTRLLRKDQMFNWTDDQEAALRSVIEILLKNGTLAHCDRSAPIALKTDACKTGIGAILLQQFQGEWRIVTCRSRRLKPSEQNYSDRNGSASSGGSRRETP